MSEKNFNNSFYKHYKGLEWLSNDSFRPYVLMRKSNRPQKPWHFFKFEGLSQKTLFVDPLLIENVSFVNTILSMEASAFHLSVMTMPRWVFYDCGVMPGLSCGFVCHKDHLTENMKRVLKQNLNELKGDWIPISLFTTIPCAKEGEWVAHNLSSLNPTLPKEQRIYGLGFLSKAFGLAYANIEYCYGITQWDSPAVALHSYYGSFEIVTAYTPIHTYPNTLTYRLKVKTDKWAKFFSKELTRLYYDRNKIHSFNLDARQLEELMTFQKKLETKKGPFFIDSYEARHRKIGAPYIIYEEMK